jgi:hypothetical protein
VRGSEGFDAIAFLGPLSGNELYLRYYAPDAEAFTARIPQPVRNEIAGLWKSATDDGFGLLGPTLCVLFSNGNDSTIDTVLTALEARDQRILPAYRASPYWDEKGWDWFGRAAPRLQTVFTAMREANFAQFRAERLGADFTARSAEVRRALNSFDVITWQQKLTGRTFDPTIEIVLLQFSKPHGIKVQGQTFLQATDYDTPTTVRIAAHEMLHTPVVILLDEDLVQALDQLISEALGVAPNPADRWRKSDDGMHVLAAGFYGLLRQDRWIETGGSIEAWLADAVERKRLTATSLHPVAARVLERPVGSLWPLPKA